jgi:hypothetical protein
VAIIGFSPTREQAPWDSPEVWERWVCNRLPLQPGINGRWDRHFDPHPVDWTKEHFTPELFAEYMAFFATDHGDRILYHCDAAGPNVFPFPVVEALQTAGRRYITNVIAYQILFAKYLGAKRIGMWGIDLRSDTEYGYERPNVEWAIGICEGSGIEIVLPLECALVNNDGLLPLYGIEEKDSPLADVERMLTARLKDIDAHMPKLTKKNDDLLHEMYIAEGARTQTAIYLNDIRQARRGGKLLDQPPIAKEGVKE